MVFDLVGDLAEALRLLPADRPRYLLLGLLEQALRRDAHFLARHPSSLFQCLWNSCWWYDCPNAAQHFDPPPDGWPPEGPPWGRPGPKLAALMESWRRTKEQAVPGFVWVRSRSLVPPAVPLGCSGASYRGHEAEVRSVACSPDGRAIVSASDDRTIRIWDARRGNERACLRGHEGAVYGVAYSPDGLRIASASEDHMVRLWDAQAGSLLWCWRDFPAEALCVAFSPDGRLLACGFADQRVRLLDIESRSECGCFHGHRGTVGTIAFGRDETLASGSSDRTVLLWNLATGARTALVGHGSRVSAVAFAPDGRHLVSGSLDRSIFCWDVRTAGQVWSRQVWHRIRSLAFAPDGRRLAAGGHSGDIQILDANGQPLANFRRAHEGAVYGLAFAPDGRSVISGGWDHAVYAWNVSGGQVPRRRHALAVSKLAVCAVTGRVAAGTTSGMLHVWDPLGEQERFTLSRHDGPVRSVAFSPDGWFLASGSRDRTIRVWDLASRQMVTCLSGHQGSVMGLAFTGDGGCLVSASSDHTVRTWDVKGQCELGCLSGFETGLWCVAISPDNKAIAAGTKTGEVGLWNSQGEGAWKRLLGHESGVLGVAFSPDGTRLVSRSLDRTTRVWDAIGGHCLEVIAGSGDVTAIAAGAQVPWTVVGDEETLIGSSATRSAAACYPTAIHHLTPHPNGQLWVGAHADYLCLFTLEGQLR
jgi:WD40 repeat protein